MASMSTEKASSSLSFFSTPQWKFDVFLSFRGEDTLYSFKDRLYDALKQKDIFTFKDDGKLEKGKSISLERLKAIEESRFVIVIFSKNYASSTWCLDELVKVTRWMKETGMTILPVFYNVDPSDVREQTGTFAKAFLEHEEHFKENKEKVQTWRAALREVANLAGWHLQNETETKFIQNIVRLILNKLSDTFLVDTNGLVGINLRVEKLKSHLAMESNDVRIIGICGTGGMGKTTLARVVYGMISNQFEASCFIANVREVFKKYGLLWLQQTLLNELLMHNDMNVQGVDCGVLIKNRLCHKKIFLILDDVNELDQLNKLVGGHDWFGPGSRIIITTRDVHLLTTRKVDGIYEIEGLNYDEAFQLFNLKAFGKEHPTKDYLELSQAFIHYASGLPLAIEVFGSFLFKRRIDEWQSALDRLEKFPERKILNVLKISYDGLQETEKEIFLDIACFFNHMSRDFIIEIVDHLELLPKIELRVLNEKSLIKFHDKQLWMHDLLQQMGRDIVRHECSKDPGKRSRLWVYKDIDDVLTKNMGTEAVQSIVLELSEPKKVYWDREAFSKMKCLKLLQIHRVQLMHDPKHLPNSLRFLDWSEYPSKSLPSSFQSNELVKLRLNCSNIERLWKGTKSFERLKFIELNNSLKLIETPDITEVPVLEKLILEDCIKLCEIHPSVGVHERLTLLNLKGCKSLKILPNKFEMKSLDILILSGCLKLKRIPEFAKNMGCVSGLYLDGIAITKLPTSIGNLTRLTSLSVRDCENLISLPLTLFNMESLVNINFSGCSKLCKLLENLGTTESVEELDVGGSAIRMMHSSNAFFQTLKKLAFGGFKLRSPDPICSLSTSLLRSCSLINLDISYCNLNAIPNDICCLSSLKDLDLSGNNFGCLPESIAQLSVLKSLKVKNCTSLLSLPKLPLNIDCIWGFGCTSLETVPNLLKPNSLCEAELWLSGCSKLVDNQGFIDMFLAVIKKILQGHSFAIRYEMVIPGSEIPKWFCHQSTGAEVNIKEPSHLCYDEWMGIAVCVVICSHNQMVDPFLFGSQVCFQLIANGEYIYPPIGTRVAKVSSDHLWFLYLFPEFFGEEDLIKLLWGCDENGFIKIGIDIRARDFEVKKWGLRMVYKKDIEDHNQTMAQSSNNNIIPYKGLDVFRHNFVNLAVVAKGSKAKRSRDDYDGTTPSGEGSSDDIPHPKRIERVPEFMALGNSDCEESSEYMECCEELSDCQESSESDREG
ncbi:TMV resistance protein N [Quercus suber]|uniref:TMV resistance protein N n=1 Tax=Quercus suber TaxID=58331 RepID=UPI000CE27812|nr:TMV resistance protein N-like isoform X1 [Quercus suber]